MSSDTGSRTAVVVTCSDTASRDRTHDRSGPLAAELLGDAGWDVREKVVVPDDEPLIGKTVADAVEAGAVLVVLTGGTGVGPRDVTPEALAGLGARPVPGVGEAIRAASRGTVPTADLSRSGAWTLGPAFVLALPGSPGGVRDGWAVAAPLVDHALRMLAGDGHHSPAPSHGAGEDSRRWVGEGPLDEATVRDEVCDDGSGAVVVFEGRVRDHDHGRSVVALSYEAHPDADRILHEVVAEALTLPGVRRATARHRVGDLAIGELVYLVAVSAAHRREAFDACSWLVDTAKERLPIWKHQEFADGTTEWVNCP